MLPLSKNHYLSKSTVYVDILLNQFPKHINVQTFSQHECIIRFYRRAFSLNPVPRNWCNNAPFSSSMGEEPEMFQSLDVSRPTYWPFTRHTATGISQAEIGFFTPSFFLYVPAFSSVWKSGKRTRSHFRPLGVVWPTIIIFRDKCTRFMWSNFGKLYSYSHPQLSYTSWGGEKNEEKYDQLVIKCPKKPLDLMRNKLQ